MNDGDQVKHEAPIKFQAFILVIDADNTSIEVFTQGMQKAARWGTFTLRRVYGNQDTLFGPKWKELCIQYALQPIPHSGTPGAKNATDIALTIGVMDLLWLYKEYEPAFCLFTGDQDFTSLALRLRNQGCKVYCIGKMSKSATLAKACTDFLSTEQLTTDPLPTLVSPLAQAPKQQEEKQVKPQMEPKKTKPLTLSSQQLTHIAHIAEEIQKKKQLEWIPAAHIGAPLKQKYPTLKAKDYGYRTIPELIKSQTPLFDYRKQGASWEVRFKKKGK